MLIIKSLFQLKRALGMSSAEDSKAADLNNQPNLTACTYIARRKTLYEVSHSVICGARCLRGGNVDRLLVGTSYATFNRPVGDIRHQSRNINTARSLGHST